MSKQVIILRGLPGSGKSTYAIELLKKQDIDTNFNKYICCTDDFFSIDGIYQFVPEKLSENHSHNLCKFIDAIQNNLPIVICDNTNIKKWEFKAYEKLAACFGYTIKILTIGKINDSEFQLQCFKNNKHGVSLENINAMATAFEK